MPEAPHVPADPAPPRGCTFEPGDWRVLAACWHPVAAAADVGAAPVAATLLDERLVLWRTGGAVRAARDLCLHRGVPLSMGWVEGDEIVCPYHGLRYGPDGRCRLIPAQPDAVIPDRLRLATYAVAERHGLVWVRLAGPEAGEPAIIAFPEWDDPAFQPILCPAIDIAGSAGRQVEGFLDVAHFAWVHHETFADRDDAGVPPYQVCRTGTGLHAEYVSTVANVPKGMPDTAPPGFLWRRVFDAHLPFSARLVIHFPGSDRLAILNAACPVSARRTRLFVPLARNFGRDQPVEAVHAFNRRVFEEDRAMVEAQRPEDLPLDLSAELHIRADRSSVAYRQGLRALGLGRAYTS